MQLAWTPLTIVTGIWGTVLGLWIAVPLLSGATLARAARRVPVWASIAVIEVATLASGQGLLLLLVTTAATATACAEIVRLADRRAASVAGCGIGLGLAVLGIAWPPALLVSVAVVAWLLNRRDAGGNFFPLVAGALFPPLLAPFWLAWRNETLLPLTIGALVLVHMADISAGFSGKLGGPKPFPRLSPNKTWAGLAGSATFVVLLSVLLLPAVAPLSVTSAVLLGLLVWAASMIGDLAASKIKRLLGAKDFSSVLGAHGGMADRLDSLVVALPLMAVLSGVLRQ